MNKGKYVFSQLLDFLDKDVFLRISNKYNGNRYVKSFTCWNQLAVMMFGQLSNRESLRELVLATQAHAGKASHLGFGKAATSSNLSKANNNRGCRIFEVFAYRVMAEARKYRAVEIFKLGGKVYAFDSTTVDLCLSVFDWALFRKKKRGIRTGIASNSDRTFLRFLHECQEKAIKEEIRFVREELKVKIPLTGSNFGNTFDLIPNRCRFDIVDNHYYYDHPTFPETQWMGMPEAHHQRSPIADNAALPARLLPRRVENKPFMVTEYNYCYPNIYRSCGGALMGGYAALQDHQALFRFAWAHHWTRAVGPASTSRFDSASDPLVQFTDRITSAAFLRGDVTPAQEKVILELEQQALFRDFPLQVSGRQAMLGLITATGCRMRDGRPGALPPEIAVSPEKLATRHPAVARNLAAAQRGEPIRSITGELTLEPKQNRFVINTPRLAVLSLENGSATAGMFTVSGVTMFTTAALISLDGKPLTDSRNILVLHLTNTLASDAVFSPDLRIVRKDGKQPLLVKRSSAEITLRTPALYSVQALAADGSVLGKLPGVRRGNSFCFTADTGCFPGGVMAYHLTR